MRNYQISERMQTLLLRTPRDLCIGDGDVPIAGRYDMGRPGLIPRLGVRISKKPGMALQKSPAIIRSKYPTDIAQGGVEEKGLGRNRGILPGLLWIGLPLLELYLGPGRIMGDMLRLIGRVLGVGQALA